MSVLLAAGANPAATELAVSNGATAAAVGLGIGVLGWSIHHEFAADHKLLDLGAKVLIVAGSTLLLAGPGAEILPTVNGWTADWMADLFRFAKITNDWPRWFGLLTLFEVPMLAITVGDIVHQFKKGRSAPGLPGGGTLGARSRHGHIFARAWDRVRHYHERYGLILVGPNTTTLPYLVGYYAAFPFASLIGFFMHTVPNLIIHH